MIVRFVSSLTQEEETALARAVVKTIAGILEVFAIAYSIRIETATNEVYEYGNAGEIGFAPASATDLELPV